MALSTLLVAALASSAQAVKLYVSSYADDGQKLGNVRTFELTQGLGSYSHGHRTGHANAVTVTKIATNQECGSAPSWLELSGKTLYCVDEGFQTPNASLNTLTVAADGSLKRIAEIDTIQGPVANQFYNQRGAVALAHYGGSAISTFKSNANGSFTLQQEFVFNTPPGPRPEQEASHVHHTVLDPTGQFLVFPDLGADLIRVYKVDGDKIVVQDPIQTAPGVGPRHATFWSPDVPAKKDSTYLFVIHELGNIIVSYKVNYNATGTGQSFTKLQTIGLYGNRTNPDGTRAAEIVVSPDNNFIIGSNRNATIFSLANSDPKNTTKIPSDSFSTFKVQNNGTLVFVGNSPSGGSFPRHFSLNKAGTLVAAGNQNSGNLDIFSRDVKTGVWGANDRVASVTGLGQITNVRWDE